MDILGNTIEKIAEKKAGIIKEKQSTVMYEQKNVTDIIKKTCDKKQNKLYLINKKNIENYSFDEKYQKFDYKNYKNILINLRGKCQIYNALLVLESIDILKAKGYKVGIEAIKKGLKTVIHPARFESLNEKPKIIFDGGHNENAIKNLKNMINMYYEKNKKIFIVSLLKSKDYKTVIKLLIENNEDDIFIFTSGNNEKRYFSKEILYNEAKKYLNKNVYMSDLNNSIKNIKDKCSDEIIFIVRKFLCVWKRFKSYLLGVMYYDCNK